MTSTATQGALARARVEAQRNRGATANWTEHPASTADKVVGAAAPLALLGMPTPVGVAAATVPAMISTADTGELKPGDHMFTPEETQRLVQQREAADIGRPSWRDQIVNALASVFKSPDFTPMEKEAYRQNYLQRRPLPQVLDEQAYIKNVTDQYRASEGYKKLLDMGAASKAERNVAEQAAQARKEYPGYVTRTKAEIPQWEGDFDRAYGDYVQSLADDRQKYENQSFAERNPTAAMALNMAPYIVGVGAAAKAFSGYNAAGRELLETIKAARASGDIATEYAALQALKSHAADYATTIAKTSGKGAGVGVMSRGFMDLDDRYLMPAESGARKRVEDKFTLHGLPDTAVEYGVAGLTGAFEAPSMAPMLLKRPATYGAKQELARIGNAEDIGAFTANRLDELKRETSVINAMNKVPPPPGARTPMPMQQAAAPAAPTPGPAPGSPRQASPSGYARYSPEHGAASREYLEGLVRDGGPLPGADQMTLDLAKGYASRGLGEISPGSLRTRVGETHPVVEAIAGMPGSGDDRAAAISGLIGRAKSTLLTMGGAGAIGAGLAGMPGGDQGGF